ncbi:hypothetical protein OG194_46315 [Streptomyces sp. NBC_01288]|uniref:hypothetical protein n=1 Tax=Streptomyces sp. NBC_01288 TaxID=2903814 RepID=UPI002E11C639|nr:hypothetical protein OG194_46315 [Streptomyces sp. NBC_01288]
MQWLGDDFLAQKAPRREHKDSHTGKSERLGRDRGAEVDLVAYQDIGFPSMREFKNCRRLPPCPAPGEALRELPNIRFLIGRLCRPVVRGFRTSARLVRGEGGEPGGCDLGPSSARTGNGDGVSCGLSCSGHRDERAEVTAATDEREQDAHRARLLATRPSDPHPDDPLVIS